MRKLILAGTVMSGVTLLAGVFTTLEACPIPKCPDEARYCIYPNTPRSHCESNPPALLNLREAVEVEVGGQSFIMGPKDKVTIAPAN